jgi:hypothetical protein
MKDYTIIKCIDRNLTVEIVNQHLEKGYVCIGGPFIDTVFYQGESFKYLCQAIAILEKNE